MVYRLESATVRAITRSCLKHPGRFPIEGELMAQVDGNPLKCKVPTSWRDVLLIGQTVVQPHHVFCQDGPDAYALPELERAGLGCKSRCGRLRIELFDRWAWLVSAGANVHKAAVDFPIERRVQASVKRLHRIGS